MSTLLERVDAPQIQYRIDPGFHLRLACASFILLLISVVGCKLTSIHVDIDARVIAILAMFAIVAPLPMYWHEKQRPALRDAALTIPWVLLLAVILPFPVEIAARLDMPLQDAHFARIDQSLGIHVPNIMAWANHHWLGTLANKSYPLLLPLLLIAFLVPALTGKAKHAREFLVSNLAAFVIGIPVFALLPAVGPWYGCHLAASPGQMFCQSQLLALRMPGSYTFYPAGIVCFPSFHVIWAILCARALWGFRLVRIPVALLSGMIILSTLTTGWHYFSDVLGGILVAGISIAIAKIYAAYPSSADTVGQGVGCEKKQSQ